MTATPVTPNENGTLTLTQEQFNTAVKEKTADFERENTIMHGLDYPILRITPDNVIEFANNALLDYAGLRDKEDGTRYTNSDMRGMDITRFLHPDDHDTLDQMKHAAKDKRIEAGDGFLIGVKTETTFLSATGEEHVMQMTVTYALSLDRYQVSLADISELKAIQAELELAHAEMENRVREATEEVRRQSEIMMEMSTPVIQLWPGMLMMPLVGAIDTVRANQMSAALLESLAAVEAQVAILDVTGIPTIDTSVARHILQTVNAGRLLGTQVILTGISPVMAQTLTQLGVDFSEIITRGSLQSAVKDALRILGQRVTSR